MQSIKNRLKRLEDALRPLEPAWTIPIDIVEWGGETVVGFGRVVGHIPPRRLEPGQSFDYRESLAELVAAMGYDDAQL